MHSKTYHRFKAAEFFLNKFIKDEDKQRITFKKGRLSLPNWQEHEVIFYLDAFLSAFRSITFVMKKEFNEKDGFDRWYQKQISKLKNDKQMILLKDARNVSEKEEPYHASAMIHIIHNHPIRLEFKSGQEVRRTCKYCLKKIGKIVSECEKKFYETTGEVEVTIKSIKV